MHLILTADKFCNDNVSGENYDFLRAFNNTHINNIF